MAMTHQEPLQDCLKEQVSVSVKEALERTTVILSNLHRVQSYLDILCNVTSPRQGHGVKNALEQIRDVRNDTAALLQTVYLAEIGIQSLQGHDKGDLTSSTPLSSLVPMLGDNSIDREGREEGVGEVVSLDVSYGSSEGDPSRKKMKLASSASNISITCCSLCGKRFANQSNSDSTLCRSCRIQGHTHDVTALQGQSSSPPIGDTPAKGVIKRDSSLSSPRVPRGSRGNLNRMSCKLCGASFLYKRCLHRHIREHHADLDLNNLTHYIQVNELKSPHDDSSGLDISTGSNLGGMASEPPLGSLDRERDGNMPQHHMLIGVAEDIGVSPVSGSEGAKAGRMQREVNMHEQSGKYVCPTCGKPFDRPYRLQRHLQIHNPNRPKVSCHLCDKSFTRVDTLENHMKCLHSNDRPFKCTFAGCPKSFPLQSALVHHLKVHMDGKPYKCNECDDSFALLGEFRVHISEKHADTKDLRCTECYKVFPTTADLAQHVKLEHRLECEICMRTFSRLAYLQSHIEIHNGESLFNCRFCPAGFDSEYAYKKHVKCHPKQSKGRRSHPCSVCNQTFNDSEELMEHYQSDGHREKVKTMGLDGASILHTMDGDLSPEIRSLVDEVTGSIGAAEVDERLMQSIREGGMMQVEDGTVIRVDSGGGMMQVDEGGMMRTTVTIDAVDGGGAYQVSNGRVGYEGHRGNGE